MTKILIIGGMAISRQMMRVILGSESYDVIEAADDIVGLERYALDKPLLVILDIIKGMMHGLEVIEKLRKIDPEARVVVVTEDGQSLIYTQVKAAGARGLIRKPLKREEVLKTV
jgi:two-component system chemotaxis response regulator CheY